MMIERVFASCSRWLPALGLVCALCAVAAVGDATRGEARGRPTGGLGGGTDEVGVPCALETTVGAADGGSDGDDGAGRVCGVVAEDDVVAVPCSSAALVAAITAANASPTVLVLARFCSYDLITRATETDALPTITGTVALVGGPSTVIRRTPAAGALRILEVASTGSLHIRGIFIEGGAPAAGRSGGGIQNNGALTLENVTLRGNATTAAVGGGLNNTATGHAMLVRTEVIGNVAGGDASGGGISNFGVLTMVESRLSENIAPAAVGGGGGLVTHAGATTGLHQSTLDRNTTGGRGGAMLNRGATRLDRALLQLNAAADGGGGVFNEAPLRVTVSRSIIQRNEPNNCFPLNTIPGCAN
jgi:hypothetical protein